MKKTIADVIFEEGLEKDRQENLFTILDARFGEVSAELTAKVKSIRDSGLLNQLIRLAATCESRAKLEAEILRNWAWFKTG